MTTKTMGMWVVFYTYTSPKNELLDEYEIVEDQGAAEKRLAELKLDETIHAAGIGSIHDSTEHWHDGHNLH